MDNTRTVGSTDIHPAYRTVGMAPGDYIDVVQTEIDRLLKQSNGNRLKAVALGFRRMRENGLITDSDLERLETVSLAIIGAEQGKRPPEEVVAKLDTIYLEALADPRSSSMGTTMIGVTYSLRSKQVANAGGLMGMLIGGLITGGPVGALVGGLVGYVATNACADED